MAPRWTITLTLLVCSCSHETSTKPEVERQPALSGEELYATHCAECHAAGDATKAPSLIAMKQTGVSRVLFAITNGTMKTEAATLSLPEQIRVAKFVGTSGTSYQTPQASICDDDEIDLAGGVRRWGFDANNSGRVPPGVSQLDASNVGSLKLKFAFGLPQVSDARSQPVITADTLYAAAVSGSIFALDRFSGCTKWQYDAAVAPRTSLTLGSINQAGAQRPVLFFGDAQAGANAVDALTGELVWRSDVGVAEHSMLTGAIIQHEDYLIVPVSMYEVALARDPAYECCKSHGAVTRLSAATGEVLWTTHLTEDAVARGETSAGVKRWGPSGVAVWSTPTVDRKRGLVYVGTAQNASTPATLYSDSVLALSLDTGEIVWHFQATAGDAWNNACADFPPGPNCPKFRGPDFDIGASVVLSKSSSGRDILLVGQKSGDVYAINPDNEGEMIWQQRVGAGSPLGGIHWGLAVHDDKVFAPVSDPEFPIPGYFPRPGLYALNVDDGRVVWKHKVERGCETTMRAYFNRDVLYPPCPFYYGFSATPTVVNDVLFAPGLDGRVNAFAADSGKLLWQYETVRPFDTVNGVDAHGGSIDAAGVQAVGRMIYVQSGYSLFGQLPGNVLLAFELSS